MQNVKTGLNSIVRYLSTKKEVGRRRIGLLVDGPNVLRKEFNVNLEEIRDTRLNIERFEKIFRQAGYQLAEKQHFLVNPIYEVKFGLRPRSQARWIAAIPGVRNFLKTSAY